MFRLAACLLAAMAALSPAWAADASKCGAKLFVLWGDGKHDDTAALNAWFRGDDVMWATDRPHRRPADRRPCLSPQHGHLHPERRWPAHRAFPIRLAGAQGTGCRRHDRLRQRSEPAAGRRRPDQDRRRAQRRDSVPRPHAKARRSTTTGPTASSLSDPAVVADRVALPAAVRPERGRSACKPGRAHGHRCHPGARCRRGRGQRYIRRFARQCAAMHRRMLLVGG